MRDKISREMRSHPVRMTRGLNHSIHPQYINENTGWNKGNLEGKGSVTGNI